VSHRTIYIIVGAVVAVLLVVMLATFDYGTPNKDEAKANDLIAAYQDAGLTNRLDAEQLAKLLGDDGGAVCQAAADLPSGHAVRGYVKLRFGVGGEFYFRPTRLDRNLVARSLLIVKTYCPDQLPDVRNFVDGLRLADVNGD